jgi:hypothetical protein
MLDYEGDALRQTALRQEEQISQLKGIRSALAALTQPLRWHECLDSGSTERATLGDINRELRSLHNELRNIRTSVSVIAFCVVVWFVHAVSANWPSWAHW